MKVIFVGMHNKDGRKPLCSYTKSGKLIDRIIEKISCKWLKTNLYDVDYWPQASNEKWSLAREWHERIDVYMDDLIILLGEEVHKNFIDRYIDDNRILKFAHPASKRSHVAMDEYVEKMIKAIKECSNQCSHCGAQVYDPMMGNVVVHDIVKCKAENELR